MQLSKPNSRLFSNDELASQNPFSPANNFIACSISKWVNLLQQFSWNYGDIFIVLLAIGINFRFNQFNDYFRIVLDNEHLMTPSTWRELRVHYFQLVDLVYFIDSHVSGLILISMGHNMIILIVKIFNAFK